ncbi:B12-binding domain-containing protein [Nereida sp. MMG025]|uniref:cobalamin B12-binding domain-containing protein n=1 Tax=Nereida sp. MMG025 TaxID=2909981 RepID=UPI001F37F8FB|nr:cobalamin B12-binding domain-containing protein [Nereida sp. MMG025]MCF6446018.1 cobalamin B12-binding domain-containing protein [Nereida sp. MMG025]
MSDNNEMRKSRSEDVDSLAERVLRTLAVTRSSKPDAQSDARADFVLSLCMAVGDFDPNARKMWVAEAMQLGLSATDICETYIPSAARVLGERWCTDQVSFADVTIGVARLQGMLRDLMPEAELLSAMKVGKSPVVLMVVPEGEYHTLGAMVTARKLRRNGVSVKLIMDRPVAEVAALVEQVDFDAVMVSLSSGERLEVMRQFVLHIRKVAGDALPILIGGPVANEQVDVKSLTGADHVENDPIKALLSCGLTISDRAEPANSSRE